MSQRKRKLSPRRKSSQKPATQNAVSLNYKDGETTGNLGGFAALVLAFGICVALFFLVAVLGVVMLMKWLPR